MGNEAFFLEAKEKQIKAAAGIIFLGISLFLLVKMGLYCFSSDIWYDEVFSVNLISLSYRDIAEFTAGDVHPPLYYWYLKFFTEAGGLLTGGLTPETTVYWAKLASLMPMVGLWLLAVTRVRKRFGLLTAGIFSFCAFTMPQLTAYGMEIRMYSLALLLVTLAFIFACDTAIYRTGRSCIGLFVCGILAAYTQYFSCLGIGILYLLLGWNIRKDRGLAKGWAACVGASVLAYLPWLGVLINQLTAVKGSYWIPPLTWKSFVGCIKYIYLPSGGYPWLNYLLAILLLLATLLLLVLFGKKRKAEGGLFREEGAVLFLSWGMLGGVILVGVGVSLFISPVFVYRYMIPFLGSFWLTFALFLGKCPKKGICLFSCVLVLIIGYTNVKGVFWEEGYKQENMEIALEGLEKIQAEDTLVFNFNHVQAVVAYYKENQSYLLYQEPEELIQKHYGNLELLEDEEGIERLLEKQEGRVWFLGSFNSREDIVQGWRNQGLTVTEEGSYLLERYWFNLYAVEK